MSDVYSQQKRSAVMAAIRSRGNRATELRLIRVFRTHGITGWRRGSKMPGKPDFVFPRFKTAVFVDGCFWHGCPEHATQPRTNANFWREKITRNKARDCAVNRLLRAKGWTVVRVWEHELRRRDEAKLVRRLRRWL